MNQNHVVMTMRQRSLAFVLLALLIGVMASGAVDAIEDETFEPGFVEWGGVVYITCVPLHPPYITSVHLRSPSPRIDGYQS